MGQKVLMKGNEAIAEAAVRAGCRFYAGYPITPQNEIPEYMSWRQYEAGGQFVQAESELAAINMVYGAGGAGTRAMTSSSSPGISLKQEGMSYLAGAEVPAVIVNMVRCGPGLGGIQPAQSDYFQATRGGGHGDYHMLVLAGESVQEMVDLTCLAFDKADEYRNPVLLLGDAILGQIMEPVTLPDPVDTAGLPDKPWATTGTGGLRRRNVINSLDLRPESLERHNLKLKAKYDRMASSEQRHAGYRIDDATLVLVAYGSTARICRRAVDLARREGIAAGLLRPISLWPFPAEAFEAAVPRAGAFLAVEMSLGQMVEDVRLAVQFRRPVYFYGRTGGVVPTPAEVLVQIRETAGACGASTAPAASGAARGGGLVK
ncbi:MAG: 3-methyl-2-oxobutanoate dehydrogenase subunit VorB [Bacillota bacterium]|nr:3-methyl-2-oxobutanoate dehydrogenase subunit VorB [Bacillota bacterium]